MNSDGIAGWLYVTACLVVPALWGAGCAWIFGKLDARAAQKRSAASES